MKITKEQWIVWFLTEKKKNYIDIWTILMTEFGA